MTDPFHLRKAPETPWRDFRHRLRTGLIVGLLVWALILVLAQLAAVA